MARKVSKKDMESILMQVMMAAKNVRAQRDRLQQLQRRLQSHQADAAPAPAPIPADSDAGDELGELASDVFKVYYIGLEAGARMLTTSVHLAIHKGVRLAPPNRAFAVMNDEQLHDALLAQKLPPRPTTQGQGVDRVMAAVMAVKLLEEHLLPRCVECLAGGRAPVPGMTPDSSPGSSPDRGDDPVAAATDGLAKVDLSDHTATATAKTGQSKPRDAASGGGDVAKALDYLYRANRIVSLAVKHLDIAVSVLSRFIDAKKLPGLTEFCNAHAYISEEGPAPTVESD